MADYIDGFILPVPRKHLEQYRKAAKVVAGIWKEHGALDYFEYVGDDMNLEGTRSFLDAVVAKEEEAIVFGWVVFDSREARDLANKRVAEDPRMPGLIDPLTDPSRVIFDASRMVYGGFQALVNSTQNGSHATKLPRIDGAYILREIGDVVSFRRGILYTTRELLLRPGASVRNFIQTDRNRLVKPVIFVIFWSFAYTLLQRWLSFEDGYVRYSGDAESTAIAIVEWIQTNYGYANLIIAIFVAFTTKILFRKQGYNYFEILILNYYLFGIVMVISALFGVIEAFTQLGAMSIGGLLTFLYVAWAIGQFFDGKKFMNYFKGLLAYLLGMLLTTFTAIFVVWLIKLLKNL